MAKERVDTAGEARRIINDVKNGVFSPVYLLMGTEPYYLDMVCDAIIANALQDYERDFNQTIWYGAEIEDMANVASEARSYPMMAERRLVVIKEAQTIKKLEELSVYCEDPMETTVLVILMRGGAADKRKALYKTVSKTGTVFESNALRDYEMPGWIEGYFSDHGLMIDHDASQLLAEYAGTDMSKIATETEKLLKNLPEGSTTVNSADIERNVGISREFNVYELTKSLSTRNAKESLRKAAHIGSAAKFFITIAVAALYSHFYRILKCEAAMQMNPRLSSAEMLGILGCNKFFLKDYEVCMRNYPLGSCIRIMSLLEEYDFKGKGGGAGEATQEDLLLELVTKILNS